MATPHIEERDRLAGFAAWVMRQHTGTIDGCDIEEAAVRFGLMDAVMCDGTCADCEGVPGEDICYRPHLLLNREGSAACSPQVRPYDEPRDPLEGEGKRLAEQILREHVEPVAEAMVAGRDSEMEALRQLAEEAITMLAEWDESMAGVPSFGHGDGTTAKDLAARLAEIGGGE